MSNILTYLDKTEEKFPNKVAFCDSDGFQITFSELKKSTEVLGSFLITNFNCKNKPIAVLTERNIRSIPSFFATIYSGNFYIPIDATLPDSRIQEMLDIANPIITINCTERNFNISNHKIYTYDEILAQNIETVPRSDILSISPLYGIFTSGSTGVPKLVVKNHLSLMSFIEEYVNIFNFNSNDILGNQIPFYFDASTKDLFTTIKVGCTTNIISKGYFAQPGKLAQYLVDNKITSICWVPSALAMLSIFNVFSKIIPSTIQKVLFVGEAMHAKQLNIWIKALPKAKFVNLYGSTENAGNCLYHIIDHEIDESERIPIGRAFPNAKVFLLDDNNKLIKDSNTEESGEICISGDILSLGYYNDLNLNNSKFCQNPLNSSYYERIFRTGDVGRYDKNKNIIYLCRKDYQIKLNGCRIELGDIEVSAVSLNTINSACCIFDEEKKKIVLFYSSENDEKESLISHLKHKLPTYMVPTKYIYIKEMPLNQNGKIHRTKLKEMYKNM